MVIPKPSIRQRWSGTDKTLRRVVGSMIIGGAAILGWAAHSAMPPALVIPTPILPSPNAFDYFSRAGQSLSGHDDFYSALYNPHFPVAQKQAMVTRNKFALDTLRQGFAIPYVNPPLRSFDTETGYYGKDSTLALLLSLEGQVKATHGDWGGAMNSNLAAVQLGVALSHGSPLMGLRRGIDCQDTGRMAAWPCVTHLSVAQAKAAAHRMEAIQAGQADFGNVLQEDEWRTQASLQEMMRSPDWKSQYADMMSNDDNPRLLRLRLALTTKRNLMGDYTHVYDSARQRICSPYHRYTPPPPPLLDPMMGDLAFNLQECWFLDTANQAQNSLLTATLALRAYRQEHGAYPASLAALAPAYLSRIPVDPFDADHPLHYRPLTIGYVLYSIGPDGRDGGGTPVVNIALPVKSTEQPNPRDVVETSSCGDIVAGINMDPPIRGSM